MTDNCGVSVKFGYQPLEFDEYLSPDCETYRFNNRTDKFSLGRTGDGLPPVDYITERGPFQTGETPLHYIVNPRIITLQHIRHGVSRDDYWNIRADLLNRLRPNRQAQGSFQTGVLRKILGDGTYRDLNVFIQDGLVFRNEVGQWDEWSVTEVIRFIAHDPIFYDPIEDVYEYSPGLTADALTFPITFPIYFNQNEDVESFQIVYSGTWETFPRIYLFGSMKNPRIKNITTNRVIGLDYDIAAGSSIEIDLAYGSKTIVDGSGNSLFGYLTSDSDVVDFSIVPDPTASGGVNSIGLGADELDANARLVIRFFTRYIGI